MIYSINIHENKTVSIINNPQIGLNAYLILTKHLIIRLFTITFTRQNRYPFKTTICMKLLLFLLLTISTSALFSQKDTLSLLFMGDIMGHDTQINSARQADGSYDYTEVFEGLKPIIASTDVTIANLEVTLAGPPFKGYPQFSSPDALAVAAKEAGIDIFGTANNHSIDRGKKGLLRTLDVLDTLGIRHTGTFRSEAEKDSLSPFIIEQNGIKLAMLNYTYGTNGIPVPAPTAVNMINYDKIKKDIDKAKAANPDKIIMYIHWGKEYIHHPNKYQKDVAQFCFNNGVDYIIGSHPHVVQPSYWTKDSVNNSEQFICYSMGNLVSNQRTHPRDGGQMIRLVLVKENGTVKINEAGYLLTWVYPPRTKDEKHFYILPCSEYEDNEKHFISKSYFDKMQLFITSSRKLLKAENENVGEYVFKDGKWVLE